MLTFPVDKFSLEAVGGQFVFAEARLDDFGNFLFGVIERREKAIVAVALDAARFANALELLQQILNRIVIGDINAEILEGTAD